jgi:membrane-associated protease RseP (regulator of RpoE activity)
MTIKFNEERNFQRWEAALAAFIWIAILLPWLELDFHNGANALVIALVAGGLGLSELSSITSIEDLTITLAGLSFSIGIICACTYATSGLRYSVIKKYILNPKLRRIFLAVGFLPVMIISGYFYYLHNTENASHFTAISIGYWIYWIGISSNAIMEFIREKR